MSGKITIDGLRNGLAKMAPDEQAKALALLSKINIDLSESRGDLTVPVFLDLFLIIERTKRIHIKMLSSN